MARTGGWRCALHFTSLHFTILHFTSLHFTSLHFTSLHFTLLYLTLLYFTLLHFTSLHFTSLHFTSLYFILLHFILLHFTSVSHFFPQKSSLDQGKVEADYICFVIFLFIWIGFISWWILTLNSSRCGPCTVPSRTSSFYLCHRRTCRFLTCHGRCSNQVGAPRLKIKHFQLYSC